MAASQLQSTRASCAFSSLPELTSLRSAPAETYRRASLRPSKRRVIFEDSQSMQIICQTSEAKQHRRDKQFGCCSHSLSGILLFDASYTSQSGRVYVRRL